MSIILKGIDLPKENQHFHIELHSDGHYSVLKEEYGECYELKIRSEHDTVQIPKGHGDIKDINTVEDELDERCGQLSAEIVRNAPTILEAEE